MRKEIPLIITFLMAMLAFIPSVFQITEFDVRAWVDDKFIAMECVMLLMGAINLTRIHASNIRRRRNYWMASVVLLVALYGYIFLGIYETTQGEHFDWIYMNILEPINTTMFALIAFYIASAAYRAFRVRSAEASSAARRRHHRHAGQGTDRRGYLESIPCHRQLDYGYSEHSGDACDRAGRDAWRLCHPDPRAARSGAVASGRYRGLIN
ncbi:MAG: hypothetical protein ACOX18_09620 [Bacillota bacterium]